MEQNMLLPDGFTCKDCSRFSFCKDYLGGCGDISENSHCDWLPSRFSFSPEKATRLTAENQAMRKCLSRYKTDWIKLCAAIVRMPQEVECAHHRKYTYFISTEQTHRSPLIDLYYRLNGQRDKYLAAIDAAGEE